MSYLYTAGATGEEQRGPVDLDALVQLAISGELSWETLVWAPSFADWQLASEIPELAAVLPPPAGAAAADAIFGGSSAAEVDAASNPFGEGGSVAPPPEANPFGGADDSRAGRPPFASTRRISECVSPLLSPTLCTPHNRVYAALTRWRSVAAGRAHATPQ